MEKVDTKVAVIPGIGAPVFKHFVRNGGRVLSEISGNLLEGIAFIQGLINVGTVIKGEKFMISREQFEHSDSSYSPPEPDNS